MYVYSGVKGGFSDSEIFRFLSWGNAYTWTFSTSDFRPMPNSALSKSLTSVRIDETLSPSSERSDGSGDFFSRV